MYPFKEKLYVSLSYPLLHMQTSFPRQSLNVHPNSVLFTRKPKSGWVIYHEIEETKKKQ